MSKSFVFPGQGSQHTSMGKDLYDNHAVVRELFERANELLGFRITDVMFNGTDEDLRATRVTQPAVFLHSVAAFMVNTIEQPQMVAGHSLGEFSALVACGALAFEDALLLVSARAEAMQKACELQPGTMAAVLALPDEKVEEICNSITDDIVVAANFNCNGQIVIWCVPLAADATGGRGARQGYRADHVPPTDLSDLPECMRHAADRS